MKQKIVGLLAFGLVLWAIFGSRLTISSAKYCEYSNDLFSSKGEKHGN